MFVRAYIVVSSLLLVALTTAAFRQASAPQRFGEIAVERINVVDGNGTLRLVIANKDRMHPGVLDGKTIDRPRPEAGLIFFNDEGDEVGGLAFSGKAANGQRGASGTFTFDQFKQDQTIGIRYIEGGGQRSAALEVWDRPEESLAELIKKMNAANQIADAAARDAAIQKIRSEVPPTPRRLFVGKNSDRAAAISLADANGRARLNLTVDANGDPRIEFLDEKGQVVSRLPEGK